MSNNRSSLLEIIIDPRNTDTKYIMCLPLWDSDQLGLYFDMKNPKKNLERPYLSTEEGQMAVLQGCREVRKSFIDTELL